MRAYCNSVKQEARITTCLKAYLQSALAKTLSSNIGTWGVACIHDVSHCTASFINWMSWKALSSTLAGFLCACPSPKSLPRKHVHDSKTSSSNPTKNKSTDPWASGHGLFVRNILELVKLSSELLSTGNLVHESEVLLCLLCCYVISHGDRVITGISNRSKWLQLRRQQQETACEAHGHCKLNTEPGPLAIQMAPDLEG